MSLESRLGWHELRFAMEAWPGRIMEARSAGKGERDELDFYLCFFFQCWSLMDWAKESKLIDIDELNLALRGNADMALCRDIATRYKHLTMKQKALVDRDWAIWLDGDGAMPVYLISAQGKDVPLWSLMMNCISFWEAMAAAYNLDRKPRVFRPT